eukprot:gene14354-17440_t
MNFSASQLATKPHYPILDGLRGVAAVMVVFFHIFEIFSGGDHTRQFINHGYLAVDFFFLLSGFVIGHAYNDRWGQMSLKQFFKRRLIRLHPMIIMGMTIGAICFYFSASQKLFPLVTDTSFWKLGIMMLLGYLLLPVTIPMDIRGWQEMYPLNGPAWSLFFEYIANLVYALFLRKASTRVLAVLTFLSAAWLIYYAVTSTGGDVIGGWSINAEQLKIGFTRLAFPFLAGLLLHKIFRPIKLSNAFFWCSILVIAILSVPRIGGHHYLWQNGIYDATAIIILFPLVVYLGASGSIKNKITKKCCTFLGELSYPIYMVHFPITYVFYAWVVNNNVPLEQAWPIGLMVFVVSIALAYLCLKLYDIPLRKWLIKRGIHD